MFFLLKRVILALPKILPKHSTLHYFCMTYVHRYNGDNMYNMTTNGEIRFLTKNIAKCKTVFDVGANIGEWTKFALKLNDKLDIHCFEPSKYTFDKLDGKNFPPNVICNNIGLSSIKREATLYVFWDGSGHNNLYETIRDWKEQKGTEQIYLDTLDNYCEENKIDQIDYMKIDAEGHDIEVIKGGINLLKEEDKGDRVTS